jgi:hypothetical protein
MPSERKIIRVLSAGSYVAQRGGTKDCQIAATAEATGLPYEALADAFGVPLIKGIPDAKVLGEGIYTQDMVYPLLGLGWSAAPMITQERRKIQDCDRKLRQPSSEAIKRLLPGRKAVLDGNRASERRAMLAPLTPQPHPRRRSL